MITQCPIKKHFLFTALFTRSTKAGLFKLADTFELTQTLARPAQVGLIERICHLFLCKQHLRERAILFCCTRKLFVTTLTHPCFLARFRRWPNSRLAKNNTKKRTRKKAYCDDDAAVSLSMLAGRLMTDGRSHHQLAAACCAAGEIICGVVCVCTSDAAQMFAALRLYETERTERKLFCVMLLPSVCCFYHCYSRRIRRAREQKCAYRNGTDHPTPKTNTARMRSQRCSHEHCTRT